MRSGTGVSVGNILTGRRPPHVPLAYWRKLGRLKLWALLYVIAWLGYGYYALFGSWNRPTIGYLTAGCLLGILFGYAPGRINKKLRKDVLASGYRICIECGYSLRGLPDEHRCPECGIEYTILELEDEWENWFWRVDRN